MITWKDVLFGCVTGLYSLANTRIFATLPLENHDDIINAFCLFVLAAVGGVIMFRANPNEAVTSLFKRTPKP